MKKIIRLIFINFFVLGFCFAQNTPVYQVGTGLNPGFGCVGAQSLVAQDIKFEDSDISEAFSIVATSGNQSILPDANINAYFTGLTGSIFTFNIEAQSLIAGTTDINFTIIGNESLSGNTSFTVVFNDPPAVTFTSPSLTLCSSLNELNINDFVSSVGGDWSISVLEENLPNGIFIPSEYPGLTFSSAYSFEYDYSENGCSVTAILPFTYFEGPAVSLTTSAVSTCGIFDGAVDAIVTSPNGGDQYLWSTGESGTASIANLAVGEYVFYMNDAVGCKLESTFSISNNGIVPVVSITDVNCAGENTGMIDVSSISGLTAPISYNWSSGHSSNQATNLYAGTYILQAVDVNNCQVTISYTVSENEQIKSESNSIALPTCSNSDGGIALTGLSGGVPPYNVSWSNGMLGAVIIGLPSGYYLATVTDQKGCQITVPNSLNDQSLNYIFGTVTPASCGNTSGAIDVTSYIDGGTSLQSYLWSSGGVNEDAINLASGEYWCVMTTTDGCKSISNWTLTSDAPQIQPICVVTVDSTTSTNLVVWEPVETIGISHYNIYRETSIQDEFVLIDTVQFSNFSIFNDVIASPIDRSWRYKITAENNCGQESVLSAPHRTIHLQMTDAGVNQTKVVWTPYEGQDFTEYIIFRKENGLWTQIATVPSSQLFYLDNIDFSTPNLDYLVEFETTERCSPSLLKVNDFNSSRSNRERGSFSVGEGTGDSNNELLEAYLSSISMYPNPFTHELTLIQGEANVSLVKIYDLTGLLVSSFELNQKTQKVNLEKLDKGIYFVQISYFGISKICKINKI